MATSCQSKRYGIFLGRCQPFHLGHQAAISWIYADGLEPIILLGSSGLINPDNPLTDSQRIGLIRLVYPDVLIIPVEDEEEDKVWINKVKEKLHSIDVTPENSIFYTHTKWEDKDQGMLFKSVGFETQKYVMREEIHAKDIRRNLELHKRLMDGRVYQQYKTFLGPQAKKDEFIRELVAWVSDTEGSPYWESRLMLLDKAKQMGY